jgi:hypothetical protein
MLKATFISSYIKRNVETGVATEVFRYKVTGSPEALAAYEAAKGKNHRVDNETGAVLWFTTNFVGDEASLVITSTGNVIADMTEFRKAASLIKQFGGNLGDALARESAAKLLGKKSSEE